MCGYCPISVWTHNFAFSWLTMCRYCQESFQTHGFAFSMLKKACADTVKSLSKLVILPFQSLKKSCADTVRNLFKHILYLFNAHKREVQILSGICWNIYFTFSVLTKVMRRKRMRLFKACDETCICRYHIHCKINDCVTG